MEILKDVQRRCRCTEPQIIFPGHMQGTVWPQAGSQENAGNEGIIFKASEALQRNGYGLFLYNVQVTLSLQVFLIAIILHIT